MSLCRVIINSSAPTKHTIQPLLTSRIAARCPLGLRRHGAAVGEQLQGKDYNCLSSFPRPHCLPPPVLFQKTAEPAQADGGDAT